ncbi:MAG TPA: LPS export ABC transporter periplasmic protein LptC [Candidatus Acidoferrales bacterium]|nr:LPS export ABC transporter periplasmic protein LptC [Candidatus Acidoferrales bacterium]
MISTTVAAIFISRSVRQASARRHGPKPVPSSVQQASQKFSFSKVEQERTIYTVEASQATQFKDQDLSVLEDVVVTMFGKDGTRDDTIHTRECNYEPGTGKILCAGDVQIDIRSAANPQSNPSPRSVRVDTSGVTFDRETGVATTEKPVAFEFPNGQGRAIGVRYQSNDGRLELEHKVEMTIQQNRKPGTIPVVLTGERLTYLHDRRVATLEGAAHAIQGTRELTAQKMTLDLDAELHAQHAQATGNPQLRGIYGADPVVLNADRFDAQMDPAGWIENVVANANVRGERKTAEGSDTLTAKTLLVRMEPKNNQPRDLKADGGVKIQMNGKENSGQLETPVLLAKFVEGANPSQRRIESATTPEAATIDFADADSKTNVHTNHGRAEFDEQNRIRKYYGDSGVQVVRKSGSGAPQKTTAQQMVAAFDQTGAWETIQLDGKVHFTQADRTADARHALMTKLTDTIALDGSPVVTDATSRTSAGSIVIRQQGDYISAKGAVRSTHLGAPPASNPSMGSGPAHISADALSGSNTTGELTYSGHARMWQGDSVLEADTIQLFRDEKRLDALGHVVLVFPQSAMQTDALAPKPAAQKPGTAKPETPKPAAPVLWKVQAPMLRFWNDLGRAHLEDGAFAESVDQSVKSRTLDLFLSPPTAPAAGQGADATTADGIVTGGRQLIRALALGNVVVHQADRQGTGERADYTAADEKFVLSGGLPTVTDEDNNRTTGRSLTFYRASDTIFIDSENGSRTLTRHQVEK